MALFDKLAPVDYALPEALTRDLLSPALVIYLDHVRHNIGCILRAAGDDPGRWRPHLKTTKTPEVWQELLRAGVRHFKCATTREAAQMLALLDREGVKGDLLLAYPLVGPGLRRLGALAGHHPGQRVSVLCEDLRTARELPDHLGVFIDINPGMDRTGIPMEHARELRAIAVEAGERMRGLHYYDGHLHDARIDLRRERIFAGYDRLLELCHDLSSAGIAVGEVITAGTPAFLSALEYGSWGELADATHRISPGTVVFHDSRSEEENPTLELRPAALVFARVVSHPSPDRVTCDAGSKAVAAEAGDPVAHVLGHPELVAQSPNEEHLPLLVTRGERPPRGSELLLIPRHVCPTVNLAEQAALVEGGELHSIVEVAARAHELLASE